MARSRLPRPTDGELQILHALWELGPSTVRAVHDRLSRGGRVGYTTVLKLLQIMHAKGLVTRDASEKSHVYAAVMTRDSTQRELARELLDRAFDGSAASLVMGALAARPASGEEIAEIRRLLDRMEGAAQ